MPNTIRIDGDFKFISKKFDLNLGSDEGYCLLELTEDQLRQIRFQMGGVDNFRGAVRAALSQSKSR
ncbi:MAG: hypothetical protein LBB23_00630 [Rickettsiales bacterium]|jgi:hypothetical protein|nr:hypothetical protein [Rickettsiales bacterium]